MIGSSTVPLLELHHARTNPPKVGMTIGAISSETLKCASTSRSRQSPKTMDEDYVNSWHTRKVCEQIQVWLGLRGVETQPLLQVAPDKGLPPDYLPLLSSYAPVYSDAYGVTELRG